MLQRTLRRQFPALWALVAILFIGCFGFMTAAFVEQSRADRAETLVRAAQVSIYDLRGQVIRLEDSIDKIQPEATRANFLVKVVDYQKEAIDKKDRTIRSHGQTIAQMNNMLNWQSIRDIFLNEVLPPLDKRSIHVGCGNQEDPEALVFTQTKSKDTNQYFYYIYPLDTDKKILPFELKVNFQSSFTLYGSNSLVLNIRKITGLDNYRLLVRHESYTVYAAEITHPKKFLGLPAINTLYVR